MTPFGWGSIARLGLVQMALGAIVVLTTSTLNRVMVVELALPALLPGMLVALHYLVQIARPRMGHGSDVGGRRTPWIVGGMAVLGIGGVVAAAATVWMAHDRAAGIALAVLGVYFVTMQRGDSAAVVRTLVFSTLVICNILLTLTNRSMTQSVIQTLGVPNRWLWLMIAATFGLLLATLLLEPARQLFGFAPVSLLELSWCVLAALIGVGWIEGFKAIVRRSVA